MKPLVLSALVLVIGATPARAHEGHGEEPAAPLTIPLAPRAQAETDQIELLAVVDAGKLTLYVDRYATNEPIGQATVEVEGATLSGRATTVSQGVYQLPAAALASPGTHALTVSVQTDELSDLLTLRLDSPVPDARPIPDTGRAARTAWTIAGAVLALAMLLAMMRRLRWQRRHPGRKP